MANCTHVVELIGLAVSTIFAIAGLRILPSEVKYATMSGVVHFLRTLAESLFLVFFGVAGAVLCHKRNETMDRYFGFLVHWSGRGLFFLTMGFYMSSLLLSPKPHCSDGFYKFLTCWRQEGILTQICLIASLVSIALGIIILALGCRCLRETDGDWILGLRKNPTIVEIAAAFASIGMVALGCIHFLDSLEDGEVQKGLLKLLWSLSVTFIILVSGVFSLLASLRSSELVSKLFGFVEHGWQRGVFYLLMGFYTAAIFYDEVHGHERFATSPSSLICYSSSFVSVVVGILIIAKHCCSGRSPAFLLG